MSGIINGINQLGIEYVDTGGTVSNQTYVHRIYEIGSWNMDTVSFKSVTHYLSSTEWKTVIVNSCMIIDDADTARVDLVNSDGSGSIDGWIQEVNSTYINIVRTGGSQFDSTFFDDTSINRGFIHVMYQPD